MNWVFIIKQDGVENMKNRPSLNKLISVVIIVFLLMGIGIFSFNYFSKNAENSKALSELKQAQEIMLTNLMSTDNMPDKIITCDGITFMYQFTKGKVVYEGSSISGDNGEILTKELQENIPELCEFEGSYKYEDGIIVYTTANGKGHAYWASGKTPSKTR